MTTWEDLKAFHTYEWPHTVTSCEVDPQKRLRPSHFLRMMQEAADLDSAGLGVSQTELENAGQIVVVTRTSVLVHRYPRLHEPLRLATLHRCVKGVRMYRDFLFFSGDLVLAEATNEYCVVDRKTRRAVRPDIYAKNAAFADQAYVPGNPQPEKIVPPGGQMEMGFRRVYYSLLDENGHLNNANYCDFAMDALPSVLRTYVPACFELNYLHEALYQSAVQLSYAYDGTSMYLCGRQDDRQCFSAKMRFDDLPVFDYEKNFRKKGAES